MVIAYVIRLGAFRTLHHFNLDLTFSVAPNSSTMLTWLSRRYHTVPGSYVAAHHRVDRVTPFWWNSMLLDDHPCDSWPTRPVSLPVSVPVSHCDRIWSGPQNTKDQSATTSGRIQFLVHTSLEAIPFCTHAPAGPTLLDSRCTRSGIETVEQCCRLTGIRQALPTSDAR